MKLFLVAPYDTERFNSLLKDKILNWKANTSERTSSNWVTNNKLDVILPKYVELITNVKME